MNQETLKENKTKDIKEQISEILVKWSMPTRQAAINEIVELLTPKQSVSGEGFLTTILKSLPSQKILPKDQRECGYNQALDDVTESIQKSCLDYKPHNAVIDTPKGFKVRVKFMEKSPYKGGTEILEGITEIHYNYPSPVSGTRIAFESDITSNGNTYLMDHIQEFEALKTNAVDKTTKGTNEQTKTDEQIEKILDSAVVPSDIPVLFTMDKASAVKQLSNLIKESNRKAVREFVNWKLTHFAQPADLTMNISRQKQYQEEKKLVEEYLNQSKE